MPKVIYCNSFEVSHNKEAFVYILKFQAPNGEDISVHVVISPQGCKTFLNAVTAEMTTYESEHGEVEPWNTAGKTETPNNKNGQAPGLYS